MDKNTLLRGLPKVDELLRELSPELVTLPDPAVTDLVRDTLSRLRREILDGNTQALPDRQTLCREIEGQIAASRLPGLREVINATGIVLHTNLGRACLSEKAAEAAYRVARSYSTLEYDLETGRRGSRHSHTEQLLCRLTGAEAAMVVNNNAAAVLLILSAMAAGGEVITSRGELVEIGGSFRIPEIMEQCGCSLREVGATNKTHIEDYRRAIGEQTRALLKVHTSNYRIVGFSEVPRREELVALGREAGLPVIEDLGSGCLIDLNQLGIRDEPSVMDSVRAGVDIISFSGDKLLGGPQAGIIIGRAAWLRQLRQHPLARAMRVDKMTLAALEATLRSYEDPRRAVTEIPTLEMLSQTPEALKEKAEELCALLTGRGIAAEVCREWGQVGGGSVPCQQLPTYAVAVSPRGRRTVDQAEEALRHLARPVIGRIAHDRYLLDVRTLNREDFPYLADVLKESVT